MRNDLSIHPSIHRAAVYRKPRFVVNVAGGVRKCLHGFSLVFRFAWLPAPQSLGARCPLSALCYMLLLHVAVAACCSQSHLQLPLTIAIAVIVVGTSGASGKRCDANPNGTERARMKRLEHLVKLINNMLRARDISIANRQSAIVCQILDMFASANDKSNNR